MVRSSFQTDMMETLEETFTHMLDEDSEIVTIYVGEDGSEELANEGG